MKLVSRELYFVSIVSLRAEHSGFSRDHKLMHTMHTQIARVVRCAHGTGQCERLHIIRLIIDRITSSRAHLTI